MHRCFVEPSAWAGDELPLVPEELHHLQDVMRARPGDRVAAFDGQGREAVAELTVAATGPRAGRPVLRVLRAEVVTRPNPEIVLVQAIPKGKRMETIVEKSVELGVSAIVPVMTERTIVRLDKAQRAERSGRWQRMALGASRQCGTSWVPDVRAVMDYRDALRVVTGLDLLLVGSLVPGSRLLREVLVDRRAAAPKQVGLIIGPEGDLSPGEMEAALGTGAVPVSFGSLVLRVDTAALFGLSALAYEFPRESCA